MQIKSVVSMVLAVFLAVSFASAQSSVETTFTSIADDDGWVREATESTEVGDLFDESADGGKGLRVGDHSRDRQLMSIISFNTALPDSFEIVSARLELTRDSDSGSNPFKVLGDMFVDVHPGVIGGNANLQSRDFQADVDYPEAAVSGDQGGNLSVYEIDIDPDMINVEGLTQMRLRFEKPDNGDGKEDYTGFYAGENASNHRAPRLVMSLMCACGPVDTSTDMDTDTDTDTDADTDTGTDVDTDTDTDVDEDTDTDTDTEMDSGSGL